MPNAVQYKVETSASAGFSSLIEDRTTVMTAWSTAASYPNGTIYWRVRALDAQGNVLGTSSTRNYILDQTRPDRDHHQRDARGHVGAGRVVGDRRWRLRPDHLLPGDALRGQHRGHLGGRRAARSARSG